MYDYACTRSYPCLTKVLLANYEGQFSMMHLLRVFENKPSISLIKAENLALLTNTVYRTSTNGLYGEDY